MPTIRRKTDQVIADLPEIFGGERKRGLLAWFRGSGSKKKAPSRLKARLVKAGALAGMALVLVPIGAGGAAVGALAGWMRLAPPIREFENYRPPEATVLLDRNGKSFAALFEQRRFVVPLASMPPLLPQGVVAIEDERFYEHIGMDPIGILRAAVTNAMRGRVTQGASTLTQQTARNLLASIGTEKTVLRKVEEILTALVMEHRYSKDQILEVYLNQIYLGSGTFGMQAASMTYFGKSLSELEPWECATLAGLPQLPERYSPLNNPEQAKKRRDAVLWKMLERGFITDEQFADSVTREMDVSPARITSGQGPYFVDAVRRMVVNHPQLGDTKLQEAGWRIRTTVDAKMQRIAEEILREGLDEEEAHWIAGRQERFREAQLDPEFGRAPAPGQIRMGEVITMFENSLVVTLPGGWRADVPIPAATRSYFLRGENIAAGDGVDIEVIDVNVERGLVRARLLPQQRLQGAIVALDAKTGDVRAIVGGRQFNDNLNNGYFNRAVQARRQAGSTFKPLFFASGLERGMTPQTTFVDTPVVFRDGYAPRNYDKLFRGTVTMQHSLEQSRNIPTIRLVQQVGLRDSLRFVQKFQRHGDRPWSLPMEWPVVLGTTSVTPLELAAAFQPFANKGLAQGPRLIEGIWNGENREAVNISVPEKEQLLGTQSAAYAVQLMAGVMSHGTGDKLREFLQPSLRDRVAGKSGTTNDNRDAWFAGFTPHDVVVVWIGFDQYVPLAPGRTGSRAAGPIWAKYMSRVWDLKTPSEKEAPLPLPDNFHFAAINPRTGMALQRDTVEWLEPPTWRVFRGAVPTATEAEPLPTVWSGNPEDAEELPLDGREAAYRLP